MKIQKIIQHMRTQRVNEMMDKYVILGDFPITKELNKMRYPLAKYAKDKDVLIKISRPDNHQEAGEYAYKITVTDKWNPNHSLDYNLYGADPRKTYTLQKTNIYLSKEGDLAIIEHTHECSHISLIFNKIESLVKQIRG